MTTYAAVHCPLFSSGASELDNIVFYDAMRVYFQICDYTSDPQWCQCAQDTELKFRDPYVLFHNGGVVGWWNFSRGLMMDWERTADASSKEAVVDMSLRASYCGPTVPTTNPAYMRELSYCLMTKLDAEALGEPKQANRDTTIAAIKNQLEQVFVTKTYRYPNNSETAGDPCVDKYEYQPFIVSLAIRALIQVWDLNGDPEIPPLIQTVLDEMWVDAWNETYQSMWLRKCKPTPEDDWPVGHTNYFDDLNLLIAPAYQWMYLRTGTIGYQEKADALFVGGVGPGNNNGQGALISSGYSKQFNQNYIWSFKYVEWRTTPMPLVMASTPLPGATVGVPYSHQIVVTGGTTPYTACAETAGALPSGNPAFTSTANSLGCLIEGTPDTAEVATFTEQVTDSGPDTTSQALSITVVASAPTISSTTAIDGTVGVSYVFRVACTGGAEPYAFTVQSGSLCTGTTLGAATGVISGTPTTPESCSYTIRCTDDAEAFDDQAYTNTIFAAVTGTGIVNPGSDSASFHVGSVAVKTTDSCEAHVFDQGQLVTSSSLVYGPSRRHIGVYGLEESTLYTARLRCLYLATQALSFDTEFTFSTLAGSSGTQNVKYNIGAPPAEMTTADNLLVDCAENAPGDATVSATCDNNDGCTATLALEKGLWFCRHFWRDSGDNVLATGYWRPIPVP